MCHLCRAKKLAKQKPSANSYAARLQQIRALQAARAAVAARAAPPAVPDQVGAPIKELLSWNEALGVGLVVEEAASARLREASFAKSAVKSVKIKVSQSLRLQRAEVSTLEAAQDDIVAQLLIAKSALIAAVPQFSALVTQELRNYERTEQSRKDRRTRLDARTFSLSTADLNAVPLSPAKLKKQIEALTKTITVYTAEVRMAHRAGQSLHWTHRGQKRLLKKLLAEKQAVVTACQVKLQGEQRKQRALETLLAQHSSTLAADVIRDTRTQYAELGFVKALHAGLLEYVATREELVRHCAAKRKRDRKRRKVVHGGDGGRRSSASGASASAVDDGASSSSSDDDDSSSSSSSSSSDDEGFASLARGAQHMRHYGSVAAVSGSTSILIPDMEDALD